MKPDLDQAVVVALGSNLPGALGSSAAVLVEALARLEAVGLKPVRTSSAWRSGAWPEGSGPDYLNAVALVETTLGPAQALAALHALEHEFGARSGVRNAPRVLDLDLVAYGRRVCAGEGLRLPHPRAAERRFVMGPLAEVAPDWIHPELGRSAADLAAAATVGRDAAPLASTRFCEEPGPRGTEAADTDRVAR